MPMSRTTTSPSAGRTIWLGAALWALPRAEVGRLDYPWDAEPMAPYGQLMHEVARRDLDFMESHGSEAEKAGAAPAGAGGVGTVVRRRVNAEGAPA